jgi:predicted DNA-binding transcriptional regulator AlpA
MNQRLLKTEQAAQYLGMSRQFFVKEVAPFVSPVIKRKRMTSYDIVDLDAWVDYAKNKSKEKPKCPVLRNVERFGTQTNASPSKDVRSTLREVLEPKTRVRQS